MIILKSIHFLKEERFGIIHPLLVPWIPEVSWRGSSWSPNYHTVKGALSLGQASGIANTREKGTPRAEELV